MRGWGVHELLPRPSEVLYVTLLRDPVTRTTSGMNYNRVVKANDGVTGGSDSIKEITGRFPPLFSDFQSKNVEIAPFFVHFNKK